MSNDDDLIPEWETQKKKLKIHHQVKMNQRKAKMKIHYPTVKFSLPPPSSEQKEIHTIISTFPKDFKAEASHIAAEVKNGIEIVGGTVKNWFDNLSTSSQPGKKNDWLRFFESQPPQDKVDQKETAQFRFVGAGGGKTGLDIIEENKELVKKIRPVDILHTAQNKTQLNSQYK
jgi:hypothetical protein